MQAGAVGERELLPDRFGYPGRVLEDRPYNAHKILAIERVDFGQGVKASDHQSGWPPQGPIGSFAHKQREQSIARSA